MPSPDNALPSNGTAQTDARVAPATSGVEVLPSAMPESGPLSVTPAATTTASSVDDGPRQVDTSTVDASEIEAREGASDPAVEPGAASAEGEVSPAGPRKRRGRRRKKGAQAQGAGAHSPGRGADGVTVESGPSEANAPRSPVDADAPKPRKEGEGTAPRVEGKAGGTKSRK